ncbi:type III secretion protein T [Modicisalibacter muralis]|uniref:Type III secretion protein T n=1 Tax=Modicisalibacter muralis TaxID=119000 RepID=A0A1G9NHY6_9GAMM|nr:type III secretion system export apparatus subunit SctT [Halomonas muralis]SDL85933.1 type III secretion protein T [Halomonas muralis]
MIFADVAAALTELGYPLIMAAAIGMARALGMVLITPAFNRLGMTGILRSAVAVTLSLPLIVPTFEALSTMEPLSAFTIAALLIKELLIGVLIGLVFGIPFWAAEVAGELVDLQRGSTMAQLLDPMGSTESGVTSTLLSVMLVAMFFITGGFLLLLDGFYQSYALWPVGELMPQMEARTALAALGLLDQIMGIGVLMIAPLVIAILVADLMMAYLARMAPNLHVFDLSLPIKNLLFTVLMLIYLVFLVPQMLGMLGAMSENYQRFEALIGTL